MHKNDRGKGKLFPIFLATRGLEYWWMFRQHKNKTDTFLRNIKCTYKFLQRHINDKPDALWKNINELINSYPIAESVSELVIDNIPVEFGNLHRCSSLLLHIFLV